MKGKILLAFILIHQYAMAQVVITGNVTNPKTQEPLPYCNIGILNTKTGTLSNLDGSYKLNVPDSLKAQKVIFSAIGYERQEWTALELLKNPRIELQPIIKTLNNIDVVASKKQKSKWFGNTKRALLSGGTMNYDSGSAGGAQAILINNSNSDFRHITKAQVLIMRNTLPEFKVRVRFLQVDSSNQGLPGADLVQESIIMASDIKKGWLEFDLSAYNITITESAFYLAFEWIYEESDRRHIAKSYEDYMAEHPEKVFRDTVYLNNEEAPIVNVHGLIVGTFFAVTTRASELKCYGRDSSFDEWHRSATVVTAKVLMSD